MSPVNIWITISLAIAIAIPLAYAMHRIADEIQMQKFLKMMRPKPRKTIANVALVDGFKLHERPQNVTALKRRSIPNRAA